MHMYGVFTQLHSVVAEVMHASIAVICIHGPDHIHSLAVFVWIKTHGSVSCGPRSRRATP